MLQRVGVGELEEKVLPGEFGSEAAELGDGQGEEPEAPDVAKDIYGVSKAEVKGRVEFKEIVTPSARKLFKMKSILPPDFFILRAHELVIDELKVSFIYRSWLFFEEVKDILVKDVKRVVVERIPFFATIKVFAAGMPREQVSFDGEASKLEVKAVGSLPEVIRFLQVDEAMRARRIIEGLRIMDQQKIDTAKLTVEQILGKAEELGRAR